MLRLRPAAPPLPLPAQPSELHNCVDCRSCCTLYRPHAKPVSDPPQSHPDCSPLSGLVLVVVREESLTTPGGGGGGGGKLVVWVVCSSCDCDCSTTAQAACSSPQPPPAVATAAAVLLALQSRHNLFLTRHKDFLYRPPSSSSPCTAPQVSQSPPTIRNKENKELT